MDHQTAIETANHTRYVSGQSKGHYESFFLRANHPDKPLAFWIRYTIFAPDQNPDQAIGELWAVFFNGENNNHVAVKKEVPFSNCSFSNSSLDVKIEDNSLSRGKLKGKVEQNSKTIEWDLMYSGDSDPIFDFPVNLYDKPFPKAKVLVGLPFAQYNGKITVNGKKIDITNWIGSENHNWGSKHSDYYAWGQVAGFPDYPDTFLEIATGKIKIGPLWTPFMTPIVFRHQGKEYKLNNLISTLGRASFTYFDWKFKAYSPSIDIIGHIFADKLDFVCLPYYNPPGGTKFCLNTKLAACELKIKVDKSKPPIELFSKSRAAFEILTDKDDHGLKPDV